MFLIFTFINYSSLAGYGYIARLRINKIIRDICVLSVCISKFHAIKKEKMKYIQILFLLIISLNAIGQDDDFEKLLEEMQPDLYNPEIYTISKDSNQYKVVERFIRKDGSTLNYVKTWLFDERGNILEERSLDTLYNFKSAVVCSAPMIKYKFDKRNNPIERSFWNNETTKGNHDCLHFHKEITKYDKKNRLIYQAAYFVNGKLYMKMKFDLDRKGNIKKVTYLDEEEEVVKGENSIKCMKYDKKKREIKRTYKTHENKKIKDENKISSVTTEYGKDYRIETSFNYKKKILKKVKISGNGVVTTTEDLLKK